MLGQKATLTGRKAPCMGPLQGGRSWCLEFGDALQDALDTALKLVRPVTACGSGLGLGLQCADLLSPPHSDFRNTILRDCHGESWLTCLDAFAALKSKLIAKARCLSNTDPCIKASLLKATYSQSWPT